MSSQKSHHFLAIIMFNTQNISFRKRSTILFTPFWKKHFVACTCRTVCQNVKSNSSCLVIIIWDRILQFIKMFYGKIQNTYENRMKNRVNSRIEYI